MKKKIAWKRSNERGERFEIRVKMFGGKVFWKQKAGRNIPKEPYFPDESDWEQLEDEVRRRMQRGTLKKEDMETVRSRSIG